MTGFAYKFGTEQSSACPLKSRIKNCRKNELIWNKISTFIGKKLDKQSVKDEQYVNTKLKCYDGKIKPDFHGKKPLKEESHCLCLPGIVLY